MSSNPRRRLSHHHLSRRHALRNRRGAEPKVSECARALVCEQLKHGPRPESSVMATAEAAEIPERSLIIAADVFGMRTQRGQ